MHISQKVKGNGKFPASFSLKDEDIGKFSNLRKIVIKLLLRTKFWVGSSPVNVFFEGAILSSNAVNNLPHDFERMYPKRLMVI